MTLEELYQTRCNTGHNIDKHLPILRQYAERCERVTEFGTDIGFSTCAFLVARPARLDCYDVVRTEEVNLLASLCPAGTVFEFHQFDTLTVEICPTDLLFIDTIHTYAQVKAELERHGHNVRRYLIFHDTVSNPGIVPAIEEYTTAHHWTLEHWLTDQSGLAIYRRE
jgi:hypothetical protein